jgi:hypothetical protein
MWSSGTGLYRRDRVCAVVHYWLPGAVPVCGEGQDQVVLILPLRSVLVSWAGCSSPAARGCG